MLSNKQSNKALQDVGASKKNQGNRKIPRTGVRKRNHGNNEISPLHLAAYKGHIDIVNDLLDRGVNPDAIDEDGQTPLHLATYQGNTDIIKALLNKGAGIESQDEQRETALHYAAGFGHKEAVELLLAKGAHINAKNMHDETPLYCASKYSHKEAANVLLNKGANANIVSKLGYSPLHWWSLNGHLDMVKAVLAAGAGASVNVANSYGETALCWASMRGHKGIVIVLLAAGADASSSLKDNRNNTPINLANNVEIERILKHAKNEVQKMQSETIGNSGISPIDIVLANEANLTLYAYNAEVCQWLQSQFGCYFSLYPNLLKGQFGDYNGLIYNQYQAMKRINLKKDASEAIDSLVRAGWQLAGEDSKEILVNKCTNTELENLIAQHIDFIDKGGKTPLRWAADRGYGEVEKYLLEKNAEVAQPHTQLGDTQTIPGGSGLCK